MGSAEAVNLRDAGDMRGGEHERLDSALRRRRCDGNARDAGDAGGNRVHEDGTRIARGPAGDVESDGLQGFPAIPEPDAYVIGKEEVFGQLPAVEGLNALGGEAQGINGLGLAHLKGGDDRLFGNGEGFIVGQFEMVEFFGVFAQGGVALESHALEYAGHLARNIPFGFAPASQEFEKPGIKIFLRCIEAVTHDRKASMLSKASPGLTMEDHGLPISRR